MAASAVATIVSCSGRGSPSSGTPSSSSMRRLKISVRSRIWTVAASISGGSGRRRSSAGSSSAASAWRAIVRSAVPAAAGAVLALALARVGLLSTGTAAIPQPATSSTDSMNNSIQKNPSDAQHGTSAFVGREHKDLCPGPVFRELPHTFPGGGQSLKRRLKRSCDLIGDVTLDRQYVIGFSVLRARPNDKAVISPD